ncbi:MAG TPA: hypothetical protein VFR21_22615, partial [Bradyrhizobium sp.]|nr:hypothetical protein [Bradyrhizobium sp.]
NIAAKSSSRSRTMRQTGPQQLREGLGPLLGHVHRRHAPRRRGIQYAAASQFPSAVSGILDRPPEPVIGLAEGETRWRMLTVRVPGATR